MKFSTEIFSYSIIVANIIAFSTLISRSIVSNKLNAIDFYFGTESGKEAWKSWSVSHIIFAVFCSPAILFYLAICAVDKFATFVSKMFKSNKKVQEKEEIKDSESSLKDAEKKEMKM